jgi:hypothetical protein
MWAKDQIVRHGRWRRFLEPLVGRDRPVSVAKLDQALSDLTRREGDARNELYAYLKGQQTVGAKRAFFIGEALRKCGIDWSCGVIALTSSGHFRELVALFAVLTTQGEEAGERAARIAAYCAVLTCEDSEDRDLTTLQRKARQELAASPLASDDFVLGAWEAITRSAGEYGRLFTLVPIALRNAYDSANLEDPKIRRRRVFEDLARWAISITRRNPDVFAIVQPLFACRLRSDWRETCYRDALSARIIYPLDDNGHIGFGEALRRDDPSELSEFAD